MKRDGQVGEPESPRNSLDVFSFEPSQDGSVDAVARFTNLQQKCLGQQMGIRDLLWRFVGQEKAS